MLVVPSGCWLPISIHALLAESDVEKVPADVYYQVFLSTLSLRRATLILVMARLMEQLFLSTLSLRRATLRVVDGSKSSIISIHALLAESDESTGTLRTVSVNFYPRSPCGERHLQPGYLFFIHLFLSTLSLRRAT